MTSCPICEQPIPGTSEHCDVCGFPTALAIEGLRAARSPPAESSATTAAPAAGRATSPRAPPPPEAELTATLGRNLRLRSEALRPLGRDTPDVTPEMCEAALSEASGRVAEALEILRAAQSRLERQGRDALRQRYEALADRRKALERTGVTIELDVTPPDPANAATTDETGELVRRLLEVEQRLAKFETDWKGIQGLLAQIETLRSEGTDLDVPLGDIPAQIDELRSRLTHGPFPEPTLDELSQDAARILMLLHEALPTSLEEELGRHRTTLERLSGDATNTASARKLHEEAAHHLSKGRLVEATQSIRDLRRALEDLEKAPPVGTPPAPSVTPKPAGAAPPEGMLETLLRKARSLAGRVRTLPPDSVLALEAAAQIREATDLLRSGRLEDADRTLTDLMRTLSRGEGKS